jgi:hypothetical protein
MFRAQFHQVAQWLGAGAAVNTRQIAGLGCFPNHDERLFVEVGGWWFEFHPHVLVQAGLQLKAAVDATLVTEPDKADGTTALRFVMSVTAPMFTVFRQ